MGFPLDSCRKRANHGMACDHNDFDRWVSCVPLDFRNHLHSCINQRLLSKRTRSMDVYGVHASSYLHWQLRVWHPILCFSVRAIRLGFSEICRECDFYAYSSIWRRCDLVSRMRWRLNLMAHWNQLVSQLCRKRSADRRMRFWKEYFFTTRWHELHPHFGWLLRRWLEWCVLVSFWTSIHNGRLSSNDENIYSCSHTSLINYLVWRTIKRG